MTAPAKPRQSTTVTIAAWLGLFSGFAATVDGGANLLTIPTVAAVLEFLGGLVAIGASLGLRYRREWARQSFIGVQVYGLVLAAFQGLSPARMNKQMEPLERLQVPQEVINQQRRRLWTIQIGLLIVYSAANGFILYKLVSRRVREEFADNE